MVLMGIRLRSVSRNVVHCRNAVHFAMVKVVLKGLEEQIISQQHDMILDHIYRIVV